MSLLNLVSWKFMPANKGGPYHFYCCECREYIQVTSSMGTILQNITWIKKYKHPKYKPEWEQKSHRFHNIRTLYPEMVYSVTKDMKNKHISCPNCNKLSLIVPAMNSQFDISLLKESFEEKKEKDVCQACCSTCGELVFGHSWDKIPQLKGKYYCASCFVKAE